MECTKCGRLLILSEEERGLCHDCMRLCALDKISILEDMIHEHEATKEVLKQGIKIADKKIVFFTGLIKSLKDSDSTKEGAL